MRLLTLDLERYGAFTDRRLTFRQDARLHLVFGRNEAGKSSALSAVGDLLFGFGHRTSYDFRHDMRSLRIGAEIAARDGRRLAFRRRKGTKNTLLSADSETATLPEDALAPFLGGIDRDIFEHAFGLSTEALRRGGEDMLSAEGAAGATLLAAASGLSGLTDLRRRLEEEAEAIYAPGTRKRRLNEGKNRLDDADRALTAALLRPDAWAALNARIDTLKASLDDLTRRRRSIVADRDRLMRQRRVAPLMAGLDRVEAELTAFADLATLPAGLAAALAGARDSRTEAARTRAAAEATEAEARAALAEIALSPELVAAGADIVRLFAESGAHVKGAADLPRLEAEARAAADRLADLAARLGLPDAAALEAHRPDDGLLARVERIARVRETEAREARRLADARASEGSDARRLEDEIAAAGATLDPAPVAERLDGLAGPLARLDQGAAPAARLAELRQQIAERAARLRPVPADPRRLARLPLPDLATLTAARDRTAEEARERTRLEAEEAKARAAVDDLRREREALAGDALATPERIAAARAARDTAFAPLRSALVGAPDAPAGVALGAALSQFETTQHTADTLADAALADADRVARHTLLGDQLALARRRLDQVTADQEHLAETIEAGARAWEALWQDTGLTPDTPARMIPWRQEVDGLLALHTEATRLESECGALEGVAEAVLPELQALARTLDVALPVASGSPRSDVLLLAGLLRTRLKLCADQWTAGRTLATRLAEARRRIATVEAEIAALEKTRAETSAEWAAALGALGLPAGAGPEEAAAALANWRAVPEPLKLRLEQERRASGIRRDADLFAHAVTRLVEALDPGLAGWPADRAIDALNTRLTEARKAEARGRDAARALDLARERLATARTAEEAASAALTTVLGRAGLAADTDLATLLPRLTERQTLLENRAALTRQILDAADGLSLGACREELASFDPAGAELVLARLEEATKALNDEDRQTFSALKEAEAERTARESGIGAEVAAQERALAAADLAATMREWLVLKAGSRLLSAAIERRREADQDPVLTRAGALFARLTDGAFAGLTQLYDERDRAVIVGVRADGGTVPVGSAQDSRSPMSEGTRDQMFLALRLAFLESHARQSEPAPFLGDDLFTTFDDGRTAAGLSVLAEIGATVQPILFTHHAHVVELARDRLGDAVDVIELGRGE
ncbi:AAA family ATPase [Segnochrobactraceae bacterium EtOH-i3]